MRVFVACRLYQEGASHFTAAYMHACSKLHAYGQINGAWFYD